MAKRGRSRKNRENDNTSQIDLYNQGYRYFCDGKKLIDCQYSIDSKAGKHFRAGYNQALHDDKLSNPNPVINSIKKDDKK